jgi:hypothetical protein
MEYNDEQTFVQRKKKVTKRDQKGGKPANKNISKNASKNIPADVNQVTKHESEITPQFDTFAWINNQTKDSRANTQKWLVNQQTWQKLRMRIKKTKSFPFQGCSNIRMPTLETYIRKMKASIANVIFGIRPIVSVVPQPSNLPNENIQDRVKTAKKIEKFLDHLIMDVMLFQKKGVIAIDQSLEKGFFLMKPYWRTEIIRRIEKVYAKDLKEHELNLLKDKKANQEALSKAMMDKFEIDQQEQVYADNLKAVKEAISKFQEGSEEVEMEVYDVTYDFPDVALASPERIYVPNTAGIDVQELQFIVHEYFLPIKNVRDNTRYKGWDNEVVDTIVNTYTKSAYDETLSDLQKDLREGILMIRRPENLVKIWEFYGWYDFSEDGSGDYRKCVITSLPDFSKVVRIITLPYDSGKYPFVRLDNETIDDRWFSSRGIPELIEDIVKEIDVQHMQKIDQQTIRNAPMFVYRAGMVNPNTVQFIPNQGIPINGMNPLRDTLDILNNNNPNVEFSYEREQQILEGQVQELIGQIDYTLQSQINRRQPRTLGEVNMQQASMQSVFGLTAMGYTYSFSELFTWIWELWNQYGANEYQFTYYSPAGAEPVHITREEIQGKWRIVVRGNDQNTNPQVRMQKAQQIMMAASNPVFLQTGVMTPQTISNSLKTLYQELDIPNWQELLVENPAPPMPPQMPPPAMAIKPKFQDLTDAEQAQILSNYGVQPDAHGRSMDKENELHQQHAELNSRQIEDMLKLRGGIPANPNFSDESITKQVNSYEGGN